MASESKSEDVPIASIQIKPTACEEILKQWEVVEDSLEQTTITLNVLNETADNLYNTIITDNSTEPLTSIIDKYYSKKESSDKITYSSIYTTIRNQIIDNKQYNKYFNFARDDIITLPTTILEALTESETEIIAPPEPNIIDVEIPEESKSTTEIDTEVTESNTPKATMPIETNTHIPEESKSTSKSITPNISTSMTKPISKKFIIQAKQNETVQLKLQELQEKQEKKDNAERLKQINLANQRNKQTTATSKQEIIETNIQTYIQKDFTELFYKLTPKPEFIENIKNCDMTSLINKSDKIEFIVLSFIAIVRSNTLYKTICENRNINSIQCKNLYELTLAISNLYESIDPTNPKSVQTK
ncbi:MAG: hypothetical protein Gaeavirus29_1, partial [Gaeavirus sp.]